MSGELNLSTQRPVRTRQRLRALRRYLLSTGVALIPYLTLTHYGESPTPSLFVAFLMYVMPLTGILDEEGRWDDEPLVCCALAALSILSVALGIAAAVASLQIIRDWPLFEFFVGISATSITHFLGFWITVRAFDWLSSGRELPA